MSSRNKIRLAWALIVVFMISDGLDAVQDYERFVGLGWAIVIGVVCAFGFYAVMSWAFDNRDQEYDV